MSGGPLGDKPQPRRLRRYGVFDGWLSGSAKRRLLMSGIAVAIIAVTVFVNAQQREAVRARIAIGASTQGQVVETTRYGNGRSGDNRLTIRYQVGSTTYTVTAMSVNFGPEPHAKDSLITVYVDLADPAKMATLDGYTTDDVSAFLTRLIGLVAVCVLLLVGLVSLISSRGGRA
jgi:hypothetical protein